MDGGRTRALTPGRRRTGRAPRRRCRAGRRPDGATRGGGRRGGRRRRRGVPPCAFPRCAFARYAVAGCAFRPAAARCARARRGGAGRLCLPPLRIARAGPRCLGRMGRPRAAMADQRAVRLCLLPELPPTHAADRVRDARPGCGNALAPPGREAARGTRRRRPPGTAATTGVGQRPIGAARRGRCPFGERCRFWRAMPAAWRLRGIGRAVVGPRAGGSGRDALIVGRGRRLCADALRSRGAGLETRCRRGGSARVAAAVPCRLWKRR